MRTTFPTKEYCGALERFLINDRAAKADSPNKRSPCFIFTLCNRSRVAHGPMQGEISWSLPSFAAQIE